VHQTDSGTTLIDLGVDAIGGLESGRLMAETCLAGLGWVDLTTTQCEPAMLVEVRSDHPVAACFGGQYAGWQIQSEKYFAMGSGPMRVLANREPVIQELKFTDDSECAVGVLEAATLPTDQVCREIAHACGKSPNQLTLLVAPTASIAGHIQVVARSLETCLHKLHALEFDIHAIRSGAGVAPLPPISANDVQGIGRTNDAVLYGATVTLWIDAPIDALVSVGAKLPSSSSSDFGRPFEHILRESEFDFYKIDPLLFSPALVTLISLRDGRSATFGEVRRDVLKQSFGIG